MESATVLLFPIAFHWLMTYGIAGCHLGIIMCVIRCALIRLGRRYGQIDGSIGLYFWTNGADD
jgi:hypothetical protein